MALKTLEDFKNKAFMTDWGISITVNIEDLIQEAKNHCKYLRDEILDRGRVLLKHKKVMVSDELNEDLLYQSTIRYDMYCNRLDGQIKWIQYFFNITEDDLI